MRNASSRRLHYALLTAAALPLFFWNLGVPTLWDLDEGRNATASLEMFASGDYIVPKYNGELRDHKPALLYWVQAASFAVFGPTEFAARFPSAVAALLTLIVAYELGRALFGPTSGLVGSIVLATTPMIVGAARFANPDSLLAAFAALVLLVYWRGYRNPSRPWFFAMGVAAGLAMMAKGPVGVLLPGGIAILHSIIEGRGRLWLDRRMLWDVVGFTLVGLTWFIWVSALTHAEFLIGFMQVHNLQRFLTTMEEHGGPPFYFLVVLVAGMLPWSVYLGLALWYGFWSAIRRPSPKHAERWSAAFDRTASEGAAGYRLLLCWIAVYLAFFTLSATKLPNYILPAILPCALLIGRYLDRWRLEEVPTTTARMRFILAAQAVGALAFSAVVAVLGGVGDLALVRRWSVPDLAPWSWLAALPLGASVVHWRLLATDRTRALQLGSVTLIVFFGVIVAQVLPLFNAGKPARPLAIRSGAGDPSRELAIYAYRAEHLASLNFYLQRPIRHIDTFLWSIQDPGVRKAEATRRLRQVLSSKMPACVFMPASVWEEFHDANPGLGREAARHRDLFRAGEAVAVMNDAAQIASR